MTGAKQQRIEISISAQRLRLIDRGRVAMDVEVSTAKNGAGERYGSECTPRGRHYIAEKIGAGCEVNTIFVAREPTGEIYTAALAARYPDRDWILTRILWLAGAEEGRNCGGEVDSKRRYIYIHGTPDEVTLGVPGSRGCIRMRNADLLHLFDLVETGTEVLIEP